MSTYTLIYTTNGGTSLLLTPLHGPRQIMCPGVLISEVDLYASVLLGPQKLGGRCPLREAPPRVCSTNVSQVVHTSIHCKQLHKSILWVITRHFLLYNLMHIFWT